MVRPGRNQRMQRSTDRFLTTHTGSLPRPDDLIRVMYAKEEGVPVEPQALAAQLKAAVAEIVRKQATAGVDLVNDGEMSKPSYATYIKDRLSGFGGTGNTFVYQDLSGFPNLAKRVFVDPDRSRYATRRRHRRTSIICEPRWRTCRRKTRSSPRPRPVSCRCSSATSTMRA